jgi:hypothetical protein
VAVKSLKKKLDTGDGPLNAVDEGSIEAVKQDNADLVMDISKISFKL